VNRREAPAGFLCKFHLRGSFIVYDLQEGVVLEKPAEFTQTAASLFGYWLALPPAHIR
jgi:hypothetical protein